jgi:hypothetical protein
VIQDLVITAGSLALSAALVPSLRSRVGKPVRSTCALTAAVLYAFALCYATLGLPLAAATALLSAALWTALLLQSRPQDAGALADIAERLSMLPDIPVTESGSPSTSRHEFEVDTPWWTREQHASGTC